MTENKVPGATTDLYNRALVGPFESFCNTDGGNEDMESCLELAPLAGGGYALRGTKPEDTGRELRGTPAEFAALFRLMRNQRDITGNPTL